MRPYSNYIYRVSLLGLLISGFLCPNGAKAGLLQQLEGELARIGRKARPSVVTIKSTIAYPLKKNSAEKSSFIGPRQDSPYLYRVKNIGTGILYNEAGFIITRSTVVQSAEKIEVILVDGRTVNAKFVNFDLATGLAVIQIKADMIQPAQLGNSDDLKPGSFVGILGNSMGVSSFSLGQVSGIRKENGLIQLSAFINPGNSGSPILNMNGEVVGIIAARFTPTDAGGEGGAPYSESGGVAYPINKIKPLIEKLMTTKPKLSVWIGIVTKDFASTNEEEAGEVFITTVLPEGPGERAELAIFDQILAANGMTVASSQDLRGIMSRLEPGDTIYLTIRREKDTKVVPVIVSTPASRNYKKKKFSGHAAKKTAVSQKHSENISLHYLREIEAMKLRIQGLEQELQTLKAYHQNQQ
ncbi:trypsin-like peptidase domain-containing protein [bacterium]|nr:trypsin-like peptidase domain-containing protein [bacterium]